MINSLFSLLGNIIYMQPFSAALREIRYIYGELGERKCMCCMRKCLLDWEKYLKPNFLSKGNLCAVYDPILKNLWVSLLSATNCSFCYTRRLIARAQVHRVTSLDRVTHLKSIIQLLLNDAHKFKLQLNYYFQKKKFRESPFMDRPAVLGLASEHQNSNQ